MNQGPAGDMLCSEVAGKLVLLVGRGENWRHRIMNAYGPAQIGSKIEKHGPGRSSCIIYDVKLHELFPRRNMKGEGECW